MRAEIEKGKTIGKVKILVFVLDSKDAYQLSCSIDLRARQAHLFNNGVEEEVVASTAA